MDEKRALLAVGLSILILVGWYAIFPPPPPQAPQQSGPETVQSQPDDSDVFAPGASQPRVDAAEMTDAGGIVDPLEGDAEPFTASEAVSAAAAELVTIENPHFIAQFTNEGGRMLSFKLKEYTAADEPMDLLPQFPSEDLAYLAVDLDDRELTRTINRSLFQVTRESVTGGPDGSTGERLSFEYSDGRGVEVRKSVTVWSDEWIWEADLEVIDRGRRVPARLVMGPGFSAQEVRGSRTYYYESQVVWYDRAGVTRTAGGCGFLFFTTACRDWKAAIKKDSTPAQAVLNGRIRWAGMEDQFFAALALSDQDESELRWYTREIVLPVVDSTDEEPEPTPHPLVAVSIPEGGSQFYFGPKRYKELKVYGAHLEETVWFSSKAWLAAIVRTMYLGLHWLHANVLANWGVAIILATLTLRIALFPLNQFAMVRMRRTQAEMQKVQPKLKAIRAKYAKKKDAQSRQKMNDETMALYRAEGINPMGGVTGCLPMVLQFPILIGFYNMLTVAVELRGAPFVLWIKDLSQPDPFYLIPLAMGVTMFVQQKMAMSKVTDPMAQQQQKFMMFMPFMFTFFCLQMPAGMVLYWFVNNLLGIGQQQLVNRQAAKATG
jgi:YidC/Oxa1 family membrane protein insertase